MRWTEPTYSPSPQPAGKRLDAIGDPVGQAKLLQHLLPPAIEFASAETVEPSLMADVFADRQFFIDARGLKHDAQTAPHLGRVMADVKP